MKAIEKFTIDDLYRIRKSDVDYISSEIKSDNGKQYAVYIVKTFAELLKKVRSTDLADLDHLTVISAQLSMTGIWNKETVILFAISIEENLDPEVLQAVKSGMSATVVQKIENGINKIHIIRQKYIDKPHKNTSKGMVVKLRSTPRQAHKQVVVVNEVDGGVPVNVGQYDGSIKTGLSNIHLDINRVHDALNQNAHFTKGVIDVVIQHALVSEEKLEE